MSKNKKYHNRRFVYRFFQRAASGSDLIGKERAALQQWYGGLMKNTREKTSGMDSTAERHQELAEIFRLISQRGVKPLERVIPSHASKTPVFKINTPVFRRLSVAAVLLFIFGIAALFMTEKKSTVFATAAQHSIVYSTGNKATKRIVLPDGSTVWLNNATRLHYQQESFNRSDRQVWLEDGEAFFEVAHNPEKPFIVNYSGLQTRVLGTSFNIKAYKALGESSVTVRTGKVAVIDTRANRQIGILVKNEKLSYSEKRTTEKVQISAGNAQQAMKWTDGELNFVNADYAEIAMRIGMRYNMQVKLENLKPEDLNLTASFGQEETPERVAMVIAVVNSVQYRIRGGEMIFYKP